MGQIALQSSALAEEYGCFDVGIDCACKKEEAGQKVGFGQYQPQLKRVELELLGWEGAVLHEDRTGEYQLQNDIEIVEGGDHIPRGIDVHLR